MNISRVFLCILSILPLLISGCDRGATGNMKGQTNSSFIFFGRAVDQDGKPLVGVQFVGEMESFPADWTFESRGKPALHTPVHATSGADGRFEVQLNGYLLRFTDVSCAGFRHFYDEALGDSQAFNNTAYEVVSWGDLRYRSDFENPAIYVFVRDDIKTIAALPSKGGASSFNGKSWTSNRPGWPKLPSLPDVVLKHPASVPSSQDSP